MSYDRYHSSQDQELGFHDHPVGRLRDPQPLLDDDRFRLLRERDLLEQLQNTEYVDRFGVTHVQDEPVVVTVRQPAVKPPAPRKSPPEPVTEPLHVHDDTCRELTAAYLEMIRFDGHIVDTVTDSTPHIRHHELDDRRRKLWPRFRDLKDQLQPAWYRQGDQFIECLRYWDTPGWTQEHLDNNHATRNEAHAAVGFRIRGDPFSPEFAFPGPMDCPWCYPPPAAPRTPVTVPAVRKSLTPRAETTEVAEPVSSPERSVTVGSVAIIVACIASAYLLLMLLTLF